ncbi:MAG: glycosyltransferase family 2 protein [Candidatus Hinthialibacter antarcticus]|nr:glycosyltransferase family 2 protein [Candidatus Hinthialibacter antarcticus]
MSIISNTYSNKPDLPLVSVVVLNYNGRQFIVDCIESVLKDSYGPKEILLVDNASSDGSLLTAYDYQDRITIIKNDENYGFPKGCNQGIALARGEIIVLLNIDTIVQPGWLGALVQPLLDDPTIGITGSKLLFFDGKTVQFAGGEFEPNGLTHHRGYGELDEGQHDQPKDVTYITGASMALRTELLQRLNGLDEGFPLYFEDLDVCMCAHKLGYRSHYVPASVVYHYETFGTKKQSLKYFYKYHRGRIRLILKNFGVSYFVRTFLPAEWNWFWRCDFHRQALPLFFAYSTQLPKAPYLWSLGFLRRRFF